jgi:hypothetical protein
MLKMSPFLTFLLYCLFIGFTVYYLTKDRLDEQSRYVLIGVLILPYVFMDQFSHFSNVDSTELVTEPVKEPVKESFKQEPVKKLTPPKVEIKQKGLEHFSQDTKPEKKLYTLEEVQKLLNSVKNEKPVIENYGSVYNGNVTPEYDETANFTSQLYKPLGENGNGFTNAWDHDYILLNTDKWGPALNPPPVCKTEKQCPVCPNLTSGYPLMLRDFDSTRKITPPVEFNSPSLNA